jgi:hypothetical protein
MNSKPTAADHQRVQALPRDPQLPQSSQLLHYSCAVPRTFSDMTCSRAHASKCAEQQNICARYAYVHSHNLLLGCQPARRNAHSRCRRSVLQVMHAQSSLSMQVHTGSLSKNSCCTLMCWLHTCQSRNSTVVQCPEAAHPLRLGKAAPMHTPAALVN